MEKFLYYVKSVIMQKNLFCMGCPQCYTLSMTKGLFIVEDQTSFPMNMADTWGVKRTGDNYVGPNLLGRLLLEFRDGQLTWSLPDDALAFTAFLRSHKTADSREEKKGSRYRLE